MSVFNRLRAMARQGADEPTPQDLLHIVTERGPSTIRIRVRGEVDLYTAPLLSAALAQSIVGDAAVVVVDLAEVTFMASSGLRVLLDGLERAQRNRCELRLADQSAAVRRLVQVSGLSGVFLSE